MSNTNLVLGANWRLDEWPEFIDVSHEGTCDGMRLYYPERTCEMSYDWEDEDWCCSECDMFTSGVVRPHYCSHCGAEVVG